MSALLVDPAWAPPRRSRPARRLAVVPARPVSPPAAVPPRVVPGRVIPLRAPHNGQAPQLHLTRSGRLVVTALVVLVAAGIIGVAWRSAPPAPRATTAVSVMVQPGDTLWSIALRTSPDRDPRAVVDALRSRNHLADDAVVPGEVLRLR